MAVERQRYFDDLDTISPRERDIYLNRGLQRTVARAYRRAPFTRELMLKAGVRPGQIRTLADLELLPITRKNDLIEAQKKNPPFGGLLTGPAAEIERIFISPGPIYEYQPSRLPWFARSFHAAGFQKGDIAVNTFTYHMSPAGILFQEGLRQVGASVVVMGTGNTDILLKAMLDLRVNAFVGTPSYLMSVIKRAEETGLEFRRAFSLKKAWFTGEMLAPSLRRVLEGEYGIDTFQAYAVTEPGGAIAYECPEKSGLHMMEEYALEIVDPQTGKQLGPGQVGEIAVTPIHNRSWGLMRFGTGDLSAFTTKPCPCGRTAHRLSGILGRTGDAVKVRGMFVVARQAEQTLAAVPALARFQIIVDRQDNRDVMNLRAELKGPSENEDALRAEINQKFQEVCRLKLDEIEFVAPGKLPEKLQTILDNRKWD